MPAPTNAGHLMASLPSSHPTRNRRTRNYWEPIYATGLPPQFSIEEINGRKAVGPHVIIEALPPRDGGRRHTFTDVQFKNVDFSGDFKRYVFKRCIFVSCDFGLCTWVRCKFDECMIKRSSLTMAVFTDCSFNNCNWEEVGISNETVIPGTLVDDPEKFLNAAFIQRDLATLGLYNDSYLDQQIRIEKNKALLARSLAYNFLSGGSERSYYIAIKVDLIQSKRAEIINLYNTFLSANWSPVQFVSQSLYLLIMNMELAAINVIGWTNSWGKSPLKIMLIGILIIASFLLIYHEFGVELSRSFKLSIENTLLFGYEPNAHGSKPGLNVVALLNALIGLVWYAVAVPTVVNRISRVR